MSFPSSLPRRTLYNFIHYFRNFPRSHNLNAAKFLPSPRIELGTFRSSVWRSPNWAIKAVTNFRPRKIKRVSKTVLCESSSSCCALVGRPWLYKGHLSNRPDNCQVIPRKSFERELRSLSPEFTFLYRPPPPLLGPGSLQRRLQYVSPGYLQSSVILGGYHHNILHISNSCLKITCFLIN